MIGKDKDHNEDRGLSMSEAELMELMEFNDEYAAERSAEKRRLAEEKAKAGVAQTAQQP